MTGEYYEDMRECYSAALAQKNYLDGQKRKGKRKR